MMPATNGKPKSVRLLDLQGPAGLVTLPNEREVAVQPAPAAIFQLFQEMRDAAERGEPEERHFGELCKAMEILLPTATADELASLTPQMMGAVLAISMGQIDAVQAVLEHARNARPTAASRVPRGSRRRTTSSTS